MKKINLILIIFLLFMSFSSAGDIFRFNQNIDLKIPCIDNNANCLSTTLCNLTIKYPNSTILINNQMMTYNPSFYNYSLTRGQVNAYGDYVYETVCTTTSDSGFSQGSFKITKTGFDSTENQIGLIIGIIATIGFLALIFVIKDDFTKTVLLFLSLLSVLILINSLYLSIIDPILSKSIFILYRIIFWGIIILLLYTAYLITRKIIAKVTGEKEEEQNE